MSTHAHDAPPPAPRLGVSSPESRRVSSDRASIYYEVYGQGPAILLVPGAMDNILAWSFNIPAFVRAGYRVLAMNLRGHFLSPAHDADCHFRHHAHDISAILEAEGVRRVAIAASSFGGFGALRYALANPERTAALILSGSTAGVDSDANYAANLSAIARFDRGFASALKPGFDFADSPRPHAFLFRQIGQLGTLDGTISCPYQAIASMTDRQAWLQPPQLASYATPTLLIGGDADRLLPAGFQREVARLIPGAILSSWVDSGHIPFWENPDRYNSEVLAFLAHVGHAPERA